MLIRENMVLFVNFNLGYLLTKKLNFNWFYWAKVWLSGSFSIYTEHNLFLYHWIFCYLSSLWSLYIRIVCLTETCLNFNFTLFKISLLMQNKPSAQKIYSNARFVCCFCYYCYYYHYRYYYCYWMCVLIMPHTRFRVNLHYVVVLISRNSLLETGAISVV